MFSENRQTILKNVQLFEEKSPWKSFLKNECLQVKTFVRKGWYKGFSGRFWKRFLVAIIENDSGHCISESRIKVQYREKDLHPGTGANVDPVGNAVGVVAVTATKLKKKISRVKINQCKS